MQITIFIVWTLALFFAITAFYLINNKLKFESHFTFVFIAVFSVYLINIYLTEAGYNALSRLIMLVVIEELFRLILHESINKNNNLSVAITVGSIFGFTEVITKLIVSIDSSIKIGIGTVLYYSLVSISVPLHAIFSYIFYRSRINAAAFFSFIVSLICHLTYNFFVFLIDFVLYKNNLQFFQVAFGAAVFCIAIIYLRRVREVEDL